MGAERVVTYGLKIIVDYPLFGMMEFFATVEEKYSFNFIYQEESLDHHAVFIHTAKIGNNQVPIEDVRRVLSLSTLENEITDFVAGSEDELKIGFSLPILSNDSSIIVESIDESREPLFNHDPLY